MRNALLVRYAGGWTEVADAPSVAAHGRSEALLALGAAQGSAEAVRIGTQALANFADTRVAINADLRPQGGDRPYADFGVGDTIDVPGLTGADTRERVTAITVSQDDADASVTYAPDLKDVVLSRVERWEQALKKMTDGTLGGQSSAATPLSQIDPHTSSAVSNPPTATTSMSPSFATILGTDTFASSLDQHTVGAQYWWQTPALNSLIGLTDNLLQINGTCDLLITMTAGLNVTEAETGYVECGFGVHPADFSYGGVLDHVTGASQWSAGPWQRSAYAGTDNLPEYGWVGLSAQQTFHVEIGSGPYLIRPYVVNYLGYDDVEFDWKLTVIQLGPSVLRLYPVAM